MTQDFVTIGQFYDLNAAYLVRSRLEAEGLTVFLANEEFTALGPLDAVASPGVLLQVPADQAEGAILILRDTKPEDESAGADEPSHSEDGADAHWLPLTGGYRSGLRLLAVLFFGSLLISVILSLFGRL